MSWEWSNLIDISFVDGQLAVTVGPILWIAAAVAIVAWLIWTRPWRGIRQRWRTEEITVSLFGTTWRMARDRDTAQLAHEAYVELVTRKVAIPFDEQNDVIVEVYDSWDAMFGEVRRLAREIDADSLSSNTSLRELHDLLIAVLNSGLRPHLTRWQARFRRFYAIELESSPTETPQEIQRRYPEYDDLVADIRGANDVLMGLAEDLKRFSHG